MGVVTSQKIANYYERFKTIEVTFTKEIIQVTGLVTQQVHLKCGSDFWPCVIYSTSFSGTKIVANIKSGLLEKLRQTNSSANLRFCFKQPDKTNPVIFFVATRVVGQVSYGGSQDVAILNLQFTQRPPDDLIEIMGRLLDANVNSAKRRDDRILITIDTMRKLNIQTKESAVFIQGVPRRCILRDISFSGAKCIMMGVAKFLVGKEVALRIDFDDPRESFLLRGAFVRSESVEGKKELIALAMQFAENAIPMGYKIRINEFLSSVRKGAGAPSAENIQVDGGKAPKTEPPKTEPPPDPAAFSIPDNEA
ncbi:MAG TPA: pilus assembly protein PilZ [Treponema sp.]|nr:pilus assembly protein PilZ [Treponema sp.]